MALSCIIFEIKRERPIGRKSRVFHIPPAYIAIPFDKEKIGLYVATGYPMVKKYDDAFSRF